MNYKQITAKVTAADIWTTVNGTSVTLTDFPNATGEGETLQEAILEALIAGGVEYNVAFDASGDVAKKIGKLQGQ